MERLQKVIAQSGFCSRRKAEDLIARGKVIVNGKVIKELGTKVSGNDEIIIDGIKLNKEEKEYYLLNKPRGTVSTTDDEFKRDNICVLIETKARIYPVGRLDYDTTGLIILTNDGELANNLMHPSNEVPKVYLAKIKGILSMEDLVKLKKGIVIDNVRVKITKIKIKKRDLEKNTSMIELTISEGRNHIVKRIFESLKYDVIKLTRVGYAFLDIGNLKSGEYRILNPKEVKKLYNLKSNQ